MRCNPDCDVCLGSGVIKLMVHRPVVMYKDGAELPRPYNGTRDFPCPECESLVTDNRVTVLTAQTVENVAMFDSKYDVIPAIHKGLAMDLAKEMLKCDAIAFQQRPQEFAASMVFRATVGVASKDRVSSMASRARTAGSDMAWRLARLIEKRISRWNDTYLISKADACYIADFCLKEILATENQQQEKPQ